MKPLLLILALAGSLSASATDYSSYVSPLMGTQNSFDLSTGNLYPAIARPWGMNFWTPQTGEMGDGWQYTYTAKKICGFKQTHQPSPWMGDYGMFSIMPMTGEPRCEEADRASWFGHKAEVAKPYYYKVYLADWDVVTEMSPTERAVLFRFTFPEGQSYVAVDGYDRGSAVEVIPERRMIRGWTTRNRGGVPDNFRNYFVVVFDKDFEYRATFSNDQKPDSADQKLPVSLKPGQLRQDCFHAGAMIGFKTRKGEVVHARVASSFISAEQAERNLGEIEGQTIGTLCQAGQKAWNDVLGRIEVSGGTVDQMRTFYSCLYRALLFPRKFYEIDADGKVVHYSPHNGQTLPGYMYTDTGFWDTFRSLFPLLNLVYPSVNKEIQEGLINTYRESGYFPEWQTPGHRHCMIGNNSASVLADAWLKGVKVDDVKTMYEGMMAMRTKVHPDINSTGRFGHEYYNKLGYVPSDAGIYESAARTLEYAYDDWCILQIAKALKRPKKEVVTLAKAALNYRNIFDPDHCLMRGRQKDGSWAPNFSPMKWGGDFTEGNSWHYTWSVFHDPQGLMNLMGGRQKFVQMLDSVFVVPPTFDDSAYGFVIHEIREMTIMNMGNYAHGNQPIQHMIYLYDWAGEPWKAQYWLREVMNRMYTPAPDGYCGDEDNGQTSAWYVFTALGFYPVCPATDQYALGAPLFPQAKIHFENGRTLTLSAPAASDANRYIGRMTVEGAPYSKNYLTHSTLQSGGQISYEMTDKPNMQRGTEAADYPYSFSNENKK